MVLLSPLTREIPLVLLWHSLLVNGREQARAEGVRLLGMVTERAMAYSVCERGGNSMYVHIALLNR